MEQPNQGNELNNSSSFTEKRKRGRPRKNVNPNSSPGDTPHVTMHQNISSGGNVQSAPPGFRATNGNLPHRVDQNGIMLGQTIQGVIESTFDAGYLLTMKVGNTGTTLRGVVFKPGHYTPVGADNDVAPGVQMIQRNEIPFPMDNQVRRMSESRGSSQTNGSANLVQVPTAASNSQHGPAVAGQTANYNFVPVVLHPANLSNGGPPANPPFPVASQSYAPASFQQTSAEKVVVGETVRPTGMTFNNLLTEAMKGIETPSQSTTGTESESGESVDDSMDDDEDDDEEQALSIEPLQSLQPNNHHYPPSMSNHLESYGTGKMTELLQAVQKQTKENN